ncbi:MAG: TIGR00266 family protein [Ilumatobacteraceae bacterium]|nr:TIGR00266 family protein [Ilumatobacteraceae bacterium]
MRTEITYSPAFAMATLHLDEGESVRAEAGAMMAMTTNVDIATSTQGGVLKGLRRSVLGGESFFMNTFTSKGSNENIVVAPALPGDIITWPIGDTPVYLQSGSYLASSGSVDIDSKWGGAKTFFSKEGLFMLKCSGVGDLVVSSYGAIRTLDLAAGEQYVVDTGHMVGWQEGVGYAVRKAGNWKSTMLGGEGFIVELTGPGRAYIQTRSPESFIDWLAPKLPGNRS